MAIHQFQALIEGEKMSAHTAHNAFALELGQLFDHL
jgi:hypothetical protein